MDTFSMHIQQNDAVEDNHTKALEALLQSGLCITNDILPSLEHKRITGILEEEKIRLENIEVKIQQRETELSDLIREQAQCSSNVATLRTAVSPHKKIPAEVLSEIFVLTMDQSELVIPLEKCSPVASRLPWILAHVCSRWRQIAHLEARLWNNILLHNDLNAKHAPILREVFSRSSQSSLCSQGLSTMAQACLLNILIFNPQRFTSLNVAFNSETFKKFLSLPSGMFSELKSMTIKCEKLDDSLEKGTASVFQRSPKLRHFVMTSLRPSDPLLKVPKAPIFFNLPWSALTVVHFDDIMMPLNFAYKVLTLCVNAVDCKFNTLDTEKDSCAFNEITSPCSLVNLRTLDLCIDFGHSPDLCTKFIQLLSVPALVEFRFEIDSSLGEWSCSDLAQAIRTVISSSVDVKLLFGGSSSDLEAAHWDFVTDFSLLYHDFSSDIIEEMADGAVFPRLKKLEGYITQGNIQAFVDMLEKRWALNAPGTDGEASQGLRIVDVLVYASKSFVAPYLTKIQKIQAELGISDATITLRSR